MAWSRSGGNGRALGTIQFLDALDVVALARGSERASARIALLIRETARADGRGLVDDRSSLGAPRLARGWRFDDGRLGHHLGFRPAGPCELSRLALLDDNRLRAAVAEILPDMAAFNRPLQRQRLARAPAESFVGSVLGLCHALLVQTPKILMLPAIRMHLSPTDSALSARPRLVTA